MIPALALQGAILPEALGAIQIIRDTFLAIVIYF